MKIVASIICKLRGHDTYEPNNAKDGRVEVLCRRCERHVGSRALLPGEPVTAWARAVRHSATR